MGRRNFRLYFIIIALVFGEHRYLHFQGGAETTYRSRFRSILMLSATPTIKISNPSVIDLLLKEMPVYEFRIKQVTFQ